MSVYPVFKHVHKKDIVKQRAYGLCMSNTGTWVGGSDLNFTHLNQNPQTLEREGGQYPADIVLFLPFPSNLSLSFFLSLSLSLGERDQVACLHVCLCMHFCACVSVCVYELSKKWDSIIISISRAPACLAGHQRSRYS